MILSRQTGVVFAQRKQLGLRQGQIRAQASFFLL